MYSLKILMGSSKLFEIVYIVFCDYNTWKNKKYKNKTAGITAVL